MIQRPAVVPGASHLIFDVKDRGDGQILNAMKHRRPNVGVIVREDDEVIVFNAGVLGAVYPIALGIERRDVTNDRRRADHLTDALVRIAIGALAAFVLGNFLLTGAV